MAYQFTDKVWDARCGLKPLEKLVLLRIADKSTFKRGPFAFVGIQRIADDCSMSHQGVRNIVDELIANGYLTVVDDAKGNRPRTLGLDLEKLASNPVAHKSSESSEQPGCSHTGFPQSEQPGCSQAIPTERATAAELVSNGTEACEQRGTDLRATGLLQYRSTQKDQTEDQTDEEEDVHARGSELEEGTFRVLVPTSKNIPLRGIFSDGENHEDEDRHDHEPPTVDSPAALPRTEPAEDEIARYHELARWAEADAIADRNDSPPNFLTHFDRRCHERGLSEWVQSEAAGRGLSRHFVARECAEEALRRQLRAPVPPMKARRTVRT